MIAKIKFDGKEHMAIVFDDVCDISTILEVKHALNSFMQAFYSQVDEVSVIQEDTNKLHQLLGEMELSEMQAYNMFNLYFEQEGFNHTPKAAETKPCEIYI